MVSRDLTRVLNERYPQEQAQLPISKNSALSARCPSYAGPPRQGARTTRSEHAAETAQRTDKPVNKAWIRCVDDALVPADSVVTLRNSVDGLTAETLTGRIVQLTRNECPSTVQLALLEEIRSAETADDRFAKVIMAVEGRGKLAWRHESVDTLIDLILEHQGEDS